MRDRKYGRQPRRRKQNRRGRLNGLHGLTVMGGCFAAAMVLAVGSKMVVGSEKSQVYAASEQTAQAKETTASQEVNPVPSGIQGVMEGVQETAVADSAVNRIGTSYENVIVGQRIKKVESTSEEMDMSSSMEQTVDTMEAESISKAETPKMMSDTDYATLLRIVEAEAGGEDIKGRVLVANVIMNRVESDRFPDTVTDVVWDWTGGTPQFSPTYDGRIEEVEVSKETEEAVKMALEGTDYSQGALFFVAKDQAEEGNVQWFERDLKKLFKYGVHDFYTYPDLAEKSEKTEKAAEEKNKDSSKEKQKKQKSEI